MIILTLRSCAIAAQVTRYYHIASDCDPNFLVQSRTLVVDFDICAASEDFLTTDCSRVSPNN